MTQQITFQQALKLLNQKEENLLEQTSQVRERRAQLLGTLRFLRIPESLDFPENPGKEDKINPARTSPEIINYFGPTESGRQSSKPSSDFSSKTSPLQVDSIYERAHQKAYQEAIEEMRKGAPVPQTLFPDNPHEILTGSTTLQELLDNLDNLDGIRFNQDIIREFLTDLINSDSVEKTNDHWNSLGSFPGYQSTTEEIGPGTADQDSDIREPAVPYPYSNIKDRPSPDSNISDLAIPDNPITDPAIPDNPITDPAIPDNPITDPAIHNDQPPSHPLQRLQGPIHPLQQYQGPTQPRQRPSRPRQQYLGPSRWGQRPSHPRQRYKGPKRPRQPDGTQTKLQENPQPR